MFNTVQKITKTHIFCCMLTLTILSISGFSSYADAKTPSKSKLSLSSNTGYDSNPFRFSDGLGAESAQYIEARISGSYALNENFFTFTKLDARQYDNDSNDATSSIYTLGAGFKKRFKLEGQKMKFKSKLQYGVRDKTYVSRTTGEIAESSNTYIGDRYDYTFWGLDSDLAWAPNTINIFTVNFDYLNRDYENLNIPTLSNLDYSEYTLGVNWKHKFDKKHSLKTKIAHRLRDSDGKDGLAYNTWMGRLTYSIKASDSLGLSFIAQYDHREDNKTGKDDNNKILGRLGLTYNLDKQSELNASVIYSQYDYPNRGQISNDQDEELSEEKGFRYKIQYLRNILSIKGLAVLTTLRYDDIKSDLSTYQYDRSQVSVGVKYAFQL